MAKIICGICRANGEQREFSDLRTATKHLFFSHLQNNNDNSVIEKKRYQKELRKEILKAKLFQISLN